MRIALYHDLSSGGAKRAMYETTRRLARHHSIELCTLSTADVTFCDVRRHVRKQYVFEFTPARLLGHPWGRLNQLQRWRDVQHLNDLCKRIAQQIDSAECDAVLVHPCMWTQAPLVLSYLETPTVYYCHEPLRVFHEPPVRRPYDGQVGWRAFLNRVDPLIALYRHAAIGADFAATRAATRVLANSEFSRERIAKIYRRDVCTSYFGVDTETFRPMRSRRQSYVLSVGAVRPHKGYDFLIRGLGAIPLGERPHMRIVGNASDVDECNYLAQLAHEHGVQLQIETMLDQVTLVRYYNEALLFLYAPVREPFGLAVLEAMACGAPVVAVAEGGVPEMIEDGITGCLVQRDIGQFARTVQGLLGSPTARVKLGVNARQSVQDRWTWDAATARIEDHLLEVAVG